MLRSAVNPGNRTSQGAADGRDADGTGAATV